MGANSTCHLYVIPREEITLANTINDISGQPAFYILLGSPDKNKPQAYIGQTTDFANRKNDHVQKKISGASPWCLFLIITRFMVMM